MSNAVIETSGLGKDYVMGDVVVHALRDVDFTINEGESSRSWSVRRREVDFMNWLVLGRPNTDNIPEGETSPHDENQSTRSGPVLGSVSKLQLFPDQGSERELPDYPGQDGPRPGD